MTTTPTLDVIDQLLGNDSAAVLAEIRDARPDARANAQLSFDALFSPVDDAHVSLDERHSIAAFATALHGESLVAPFYAGLLAHTADPKLVEAVAAEIATGTTSGPYGAFREEALAAENTEGLHFVVSDAGRDVLGARLAVALEHTHLLVFRPREASSNDIDALLNAGWSVDGIVTLSQLVAFLAFQLRVVTGLAALATDIQKASIQKDTNR
jgi:CMD domain protein